jgi:hypothetical protein
MKGPFLRGLLLNEALLLAAAWPAFLLLLWIPAAAKGLPGSRSPTELFGSLLYYTAVFGAPILVGGLAQNLALAVTPTSWGGLARRLLAVITTLIIPATVVLFGQSATVLGQSIVPLIVSLLAYGLLLRLPST